MYTDILSIIILEIIIAMIIVVLAAYKDIMFFFPTRLYKYTKMNMFGCIICSILIGILIPVYAICAIIYYIFHVGRKEGE